MFSLVKLFYAAAIFTDKSSEWDIFPNMVIASHFDVLLLYNHTFVTMNQQK